MDKALGLAAFAQPTDLDFFSGTCFLLKTDAVSHHFAIQVFVVADSSVRIRVAHWTWMSSKRLNQTRSLRHDCPIQRGHNNSVQFDRASYLFIYIYIYTDKFIYQVSINIDVFDLENLGKGKMI